MHCVFDAFFHDVELPECKNAHFFCRRGEEVLDTAAVKLNIRTNGLLCPQFSRSCADIQTQLHKDTQTNANANKPLRRETLCHNHLVWKNFGSDISNSLMISYHRVVWPVNPFTCGCAGETPLGLLILIGQLVTRGAH